MHNHKNMMFHLWCNFHLRNQGDTIHIQLTGLCCNTSRNSVVITSQTIGKKKDQQARTDKK